MIPFNAARIAKLKNNWQRMIIVRSRSEAASEARMIVAHKLIYKKVEAVTRVPWWFVGILDAREGGIDKLCTTHLFNGDSLRAFTVDVPAGQPKVGHGPPFTFLESAVASCRFEGLDKVKRWTVEIALNWFESYNGPKYYNNGRPSPYIWSCTNIYDPPTGPGGKVIHDGGPIEHVLDKQIGCAALLKEMMTIDMSIVIPHEGEPPTKVVTPVTTTVVVGGATATAHYLNFDWHVVIGVLFGVICVGAVVYCLEKVWNK